MLKLKLIIILFISHSINAYAQKLTSDEKMVFEEVVFNRKKVGEYETLSKWERPIRYKIYGDTSAYIVKEVDSFFNQLRKLTSFDIQKAKSITEVNFQFVFGDKPEDFEAYTLSKKPMPSPGSYRIRSTPNAEIYWGQNLINTKKYGSRTAVKYAIRRNIVKVLGFLNNSQLAPKSIFTNVNKYIIEIDDFDSHIISALYLPTIKAGMTKDEVDKILNP